MVGRGSIILFASLVVMVESAIPIYFDLENEGNAKFKTKHLENPDSSIGCDAVGVVFYQRRVGDKCTKIKPIAGLKQIYTHLGKLYSSTAAEWDEGRLEITGGKQFLPPNGDLTKLPLTINEARFGVEITVKAEITSHWKLTNVEQNTWVEDDSQTGQKYVTIKGKIIRGAEERVKNQMVPRMTFFTDASWVEMKDNPPAPPPGGQ